MPGKFTRFISLFGWTLSVNALHDAKSSEESQQLTLMRPRFSINWPITILKVASLPFHPKVNQIKTSLLHFKTFFLQITAHKMFYCSNNKNHCVERFQPGPFVWINSNTIQRKFSFNFWCIKTSRSWVTPPSFTLCDSEIKYCPSKCVLMWVDILTLIQS